MDISSSSTDGQLLAFVEAWIDDLINDDYESAFTKTKHDPYYAWTPQLIRSVIEGYGSPEPHPSRTTFKVTSRSTATGEPHYRSVYRDQINSDVLAEIWHDLPLNGEWSDLTATFRVEARGELAVVVLEEIHVF